jgi:hypothetical protein
MATGPTEQPRDGGQGTSRRMPSVTRRQLLTGGAAASLAAVLAGRPDGPTRLLMELSRDVGGIPVLKESPETFTFQVEREADLVLLDFTFHGFELNSGGGQVTSLVPGGSDNVIVVQFPPQAIGEAAYAYIGESEWNVDPPPVMSAVAGPSRLCFTLNTGQQVDFPSMTAADLLDWSSWTLLVPAVAQVDESELDRIDAGSAARTPQVRPATATPPKPSEMLTSIEYPYALFLAPTVYTGGPFFGFTTTFSGRTEPLFGEYEPEGGYYGAPQVTGIAECWTAALQTSSYDRLAHYERLDFSAKLDAKEDIAIGRERGGVEYAPPPPPRKPEVAAIWTRDYEHQPEGVTSETYINYEPYEIQVRRAARARAAKAARASKTRRVRQAALPAPGAAPAAGRGATDPAKAKAKTKVKARQPRRRHRRRRIERRR